MNSTASEGILLTKLHRVQHNCRQGIISDKELVGFVRTVREIRLCIDHAQTSQNSLSGSPYSSSLAHNLVLSFAILKAPTRSKTYNIKGTLRDSHYTGPRTSVVYTVEYGISIQRDEGESSWSDNLETEFGESNFMVANTNGDAFGQILERLKGILYWGSIRFSSNDKTNAHLFMFNCDLHEAARHFQRTALRLAVRSK